LTLFLKDDKRIGIGERELFAADLKNTHTRDLHKKLGLKWAKAAYGALKSGYYHFLFQNTSYCYLLYVDFCTLQVSILHYRLKIG